MEHKTLSSSYVYIIILLYSIVYKIHFNMNTKLEKIGKYEINEKLKKLK